MKTIAEMPGIRARRRALGLTVAEAAASLGVSKQTWYDWEKNKYAPSAALLPAMAELLGCGLGELYDGAGTEKEDGDGEAADEG